MGFLLVSIGRVSPLIAASPIWYLNWIAGSVSSSGGESSELPRDHSPFIPRLLRAPGVHKLKLCLHRGDSFPFRLGQQVLAYVDGPESYPFDTPPRQVWPSQEGLPLNRHQRQRPEARRPVSRALLSINLSLPLLSCSVGLTSLLGANVGCHLCSSLNDIKLN